MAYRLFYTPYWCPEIATCSRAAAHEPSFNLRGGQRRCSECGAELVAGRRRIRKRVLATLVIVASFVGAIGYRIAFPTLLTQVDFAAPLTRVDRAAGVVSVEVVRSVFEKEPLVVRYHSENGTAQAGSEFTAAAGEIFFAPGEHTKQIVVPLQPAASVLSRDSNFFIVIDNVAGNPRHTVIIHEQGVSKDLLEKAQLLVDSLSLLATEMAKMVAQKRYIRTYLSQSNRPDPNIVKKYTMLESNIARAREKYLLLFRDAAQLDPAIVKKSIENKLTALNRAGEDFVHQYQATQRMHEQLLLFLETGVPEPDAWTNELGNIHPDAENLIGA
jgi:hypothetical protein